MSDVFRIDLDGDWLGTTVDPDEATLAPLVVCAEDFPMTEVYDALAKCIRSSIRVPAVRVAHWLITQWWRLRWEAKPNPVTRQWRLSHSMAGLGGGYAWPDLEMASDGEHVQVRMWAEREADAAAIRFLRDATIEVPAESWERAVDRFLDVVQERLAAVLPEATEIAEIRAELRTEREDPTLALRCRRAAKAGLHPEDADEEWHAAVKQLAVESGEKSAEEILAITHDGRAGLRAIEVLRSAGDEVDLSAVSGVVVSATGKIWERAEDAARRAREQLGIGEGPIDDEKFGELIGHKVPFEGPATEKVGNVDLAGGYRLRDGEGTTRVRLGTWRPPSQRFRLARLLGLAVLLPPDERALVVTSVKSAVQKFSRAFAQEFLCPWAELDAFTDEHGTDEDAISWAASRYGVSEMAITTSLVNHGKVDRDRLALFER